MDEVQIKRQGKTYYVGRAGDAGGLVLDLLVPERRNQEAAEAVLARLVEGYPDAPRVAVTAKRGS